jgi:hypothetical protein
LFYGLFKIILGNEVLREAIVDEADDGNLSSPEDELFYLDEG